MGIFNEILAKSSIGRHSGQAIWKYQLSELDFQRLRVLIMDSTRLSELDCRDCTLYYAEWWKRCYNGGPPSKREVFASVSNGQSFDEEDFFRYAKLGANQLGVKWIKGQNTQYFKTLLFQGGLPLLHIASNKGDYKKLLLKLLELNPSSIDDFAFLSEITGMLPFSGRNDEIYECCLAIVTAIINDDIEYLKLLEQSSELSEITGELRVKKRSLTIGKKKTGFRAIWVLEQKSSSIRLYLGLKDMSDQSFRDLFGLAVDELDQEYRMFYNDELICKFSRLTDRSMRLKWLGEHSLQWDGSDNLPDISIVGSNGDRFDCQHLVSRVPSIDRPTLWRQYSEDQWVMEKGFNTSESEAMVLIPKDFAYSGDWEANSLVLNGKGLTMFVFKGNVTISGPSAHFQFRTDQRRIDWLIQDCKPKWVNRSNHTIVRSTPKVLVLDEKGEVVSGAVLKWRLRNELEWHPWAHSMALGIVEICIQLGQVTEVDCVFNIGQQLTLREISSSFAEATIEVGGNPFLFTVGDGLHHHSEKLGDNRIKVLLNSLGAVPAAIPVLLRAANQRSGLRFEMHPPFRGVEIMDNLQNTVPSDVHLSFGRLNGFRLLSNQGKLRVNLWNTNMPGLLASEPLSDTFVPMRTFLEKMSKLYALCDPMDGEAEIKMEIVEERHGNSAKVKEYAIKRYDRQLIWDFEENGSARISAGGEDVEVFAVPLDCDTSQVLVRQLAHDNKGYYFFDINEQVDKFVVFAKAGAVRFQPIFVSRDPMNIPTTEEDRLVRVEGFVRELLEGGMMSDSWMKLLAYYRICQQYQLPNSCFDILRASGWSSNLAAKLFVLLTGYETAAFAETGCAGLELDLGFSFHWVCRDDWGLAMMWAGLESGADFTSEIAPAIKAYLEGQQPENEFAKFSAYVLQDAVPRNRSFHLNTRISQLRGELGGRVLKELPKRFPKIAHVYFDILPVKQDNAVVDILLRAPLIAALSVTGRDMALWQPKNETKRRNIRYAQQLSPQWYAEALNYCLTNLHTYEL